MSKRKTDIIQHLRLQLTMWFVLLVMLVYLADSGIALFFLDSRSANVIYQQLSQQCLDIAPAVMVDGEAPTLKNWNKMSKRLNLKSDSTIQLFDRPGKLLESYGSPGVPVLESGRLAGSVYSSNCPVGNYGFVQVQESVKKHDEHLFNLGLGKLYRALIISIAVGLCGWLYSGRAIKPIIKSLNTLQTFVADAGHELRTPVTLIEGSLETIEAELVDHNISTDLLQIIVRASARLKHLSHDLLLLARMENPALELRTVFVDAKNVVDNVMSELFDQASSRGVSLNVGDLPTVGINGDKDALICMVSNLVENAISYTQPGGTVKANLWRQDSQAFISIEDSGIGIPKESLPYIFDRFYRVDKARSRGVGGSGLGLAIVKAIVDAHGGEITVESKLDVGSKFTVCMPAANVPLVAMPPATIATKS